MKTYLSITISSLLFGAGIAFAQNSPEKPKPNAVATGIVELPANTNTDKPTTESPAPGAPTPKPQATGVVQLRPAPPDPTPPPAPKKVEKVLKLTPGEIVVKRAKLQPRIVEVENTTLAKEVAAEPARPKTKTFVIVVEEKVGENLYEKLRQTLEREIQVISPTAQ